MKLFQRLLTSQLAPLQPGGAAVGAGAGSTLPVGLQDHFRGRLLRASGGAEVGAAAGLSMGREQHVGAGDAGVAGGKGLHSFTVQLSLSRV
jgi:hypothetical protein